LTTPVQFRARIQRPKTTAFHAFEFEETPVGLLNWFKSAPNNMHADEDALWMTPEAKLRGLCENIEAQLPHSSLVLVVAHFPATLTQIKAEVEHYRLTPVVHDQALTTANVRRLADQGSAPPVVLVLAERLAPDPSPEPVAGHAKPVTILVGERHFLRGNDEKILEFAKGLGRPCRLRFHLSLRDPLMEAIGGDWIAGMVGNLGAKETDAIESRMITRQIQNAQVQFTKRGMNDCKADSPEQWLALNAPQPVAR
jgi:hypothetical protein